MDSNKKRKLAEAEEEDVEQEEVEEEEEEEEQEEEEEEEEEGEEEEQNGEAGDGAVSAGDVRALIEPFSKEQIMHLLQEAARADPKVLAKIRKLADEDPAHRKLFIRGLGWDITADALKAVFSQYGDIDECSVIKDKQTGKSKGYGFVTFTHMDAARRALKDPSKKIEGRVTVAQLASVGPSLPSNDHSGRKIYVGNVPHDLSADKLLSVFSQYGDIEEGPLGFDKQTGKSKGYALFVYKSADSAKKALKKPAKTIDGHQVNCKIATSDGGQKVKFEASDLALAQAGGIVGAAPNLSYSALSGLLPLNQGILGQHSLTPAVLAAQGLLTGLNPNTGLAGLNPSLHPSVAHQLALNSSLNSSLNPALNSSLSSSLNASLSQGGSQSLSQASLASYGLHGLGMYGSQIAGLGGSSATSLYGAPASSVSSQTGILQGTGQGYPTSQLGQGSTARSQSLSGYFGN